jgi:hypothetical protein
VEAIISWKAIDSIARSAYLPRRAAIGDHRIHRRVQPNRPRPPASHSPLTRATIGTRQALTARSSSPIGDDP